MCLMDCKIWNWEAGKETNGKPELNQNELISLYEKKKNKQIMYCKNTQMIATHLYFLKRIFKLNVAILHVEI